MLKNEDLEYFVTVLRFLLNYSVRFVFAGVVVYSFTLAITNYYDYFSWHVMLCTFGYAPLMAESIMMFAGDELWSKQMSRRTKNIVHGVLVSVGTTFAIIGNALMFHNYTPGYHLYTVHGWTGLASMILLIVSLFFGLAAHFAKEMKSILPFTAVGYKFVHNLFGLAAYVVGMTSLCYAFYTDWFVYYTTKESRMVALVGTILATIWSSNDSIKSGINQLRTMLGI